MRYIFLAFVLYLLYKLIFDLVIPVSRATSQVRSKMKEMQQMQEEQFRQQQTHSSSSTASTNSHHNNSSSATSGKEGDYIDFEEIK